MVQKADHPDTEVLSFNYKMKLVNRIYNMLGQVLCMIMFSPFAFGMKCVRTETQGLHGPDLIPQSVIYCLCDLLVP